MDAKGIEDFEPGLDIEEYAQRRENWKHTARHVMAYAFVIVFLFLVIAYTYSGLGYDRMPDYLIAIVSTIIGFYFGSKDDN